MQEWVRQTSHHHHYQEESTNDFDDLELERFAYDIAESLVSSMEKNAGIQTKVCHFFRCFDFLFLSNCSISQCQILRFSMTLHVCLFFAAAYFFA